ncbi:MAG: hypothetical protein ACJA2F_000238, partial [Nitriliruptoraceae bacterium]
DPVQAEPETAQVEPAAAAPEASNGPDAVPDWLRLPTEVDDNDELRVDEVRVDLDADIEPAGQDGGRRGS